MMGQVRAKGERVLSALKDRFSQHPHIGNIRGRGLFLGMEFVEDRESKTAFAPSQGIHRAFKAAAFEAGLICYPMGGTIDGQHGDHVLLAPPFIISDSEIDLMVDRLEEAVKKVFN